MSGVNKFGSQKVQALRIHFIKRLHRETIPDFSPTMPAFCDLCTGSSFYALPPCLPGDCNMPSVSGPRLRVYSFLPYVVPKVGCRRSRGMNGIRLADAEIQAVDENLGA